MTKGLAIVSDLHVNSYVGLCPPVFDHKGGQHRANEAQLWLWSHWLEYCKFVKSSAKRNRAKLIAILNGDLCDLHPKETMLITRDKVDMLRLTYAALEPLISVADKVFVVIGTSSHTDGFEDKIAEDIGAEKFSEYQWAFPTLHIDVEGHLIWAAHHGRMGRLAHTKRIAAIRIAAETGMDCFERNIRPPELIFRSHQHRWSDSGSNHRVRCIYTPAWQFPTGFINMLDPDAVAEVGGVFVLAEKNKPLEVHKYEVPVYIDPPLEVK